MLNLSSPRNHAKPPVFAHRHSTFGRHYGHLQATQTVVSYSEVPKGSDCKDQVPFLCEGWVSVQNFRKSPLLKKSGSGSGAINISCHRENYTTDVFFRQRDLESRLKARESNAITSSAAGCFKHDQDGECPSGVWDQGYSASLHATRYTTGQLCFSRVSKGN